MLCGLWILLPQPGIETVPPIRAAQVLITEPPWNSICFFLIYCCSFISFLRWKLIFVFSVFLEVGFQPFILNTGHIFPLFCFFLFLIS